MRRFIKLEQNASGSSRLTDKSRERGVALVAALFALMLLSAIGLGLMYATNMDTDVNFNYRDAVRAGYAARSGVEEVRDRLRTANANPITPPTALPGAASGSVIYVINSNGGTAVQPWSSTNVYRDPELCHEKFTYGGTALSDSGTGLPCDASALPSGSTWYATTASTAPNVGTSSALDYRWVRLNIKGNASAAPFYVNGVDDNHTTIVCWDPANRRQILLPAGQANCDVAGLRTVYMVTSLAVTPNGSRRLTQAEVAKFSLPPIPSALTLLGPNPTYGAPTSNNFVVQGTDHANSLCSNITGDPQPGVGVSNATADATFTASIPINRLDHYTGSGAWPDVQNVSSDVVGLGTVADLQVLTQLVRDNANIIQNGRTSAVIPTLGTAANPMVTFIDGDATIHGNTSGGGLLFVTGSLNISGNFNYNGLIMVVGRGMMTVGGGGGAQIYGGVFLAKILDDSYNVLPSLGNPTLDWSGGGGNGIYYDTCYISRATGGTAYQMLSFREFPY